MHINYKIDLYNPISNYIHPTEDIRSFGEYNVSISNIGVKVTGEYSSERNTIKACSNTFIGDTYSLGWDNSFNFQQEEVIYVDVEDVFNLIGNSINTEDFLKLKNKLKLAKKQIDGTYTIDHVIERKEDVIFITIDNEGLVELIDINLQPYTNSFQALTDKLLCYFIISKPAKVDSDDLLFIPTKDLIKIPEGFVTISSSLTTETGNKLRSVSDGIYLLQTKNSTILNSSLEISIDGYVCNKYLTHPLETVLIEFSDNYEQFYNLNTENSNLTDNLTLIYKLTENNLLEEVLCIAKDIYVEDSIITNQASLETQFALLKQADKEFKKQYVFKQYKIKILTDIDEFEILDNKLLSYFKDNKSKFENKIIKL